MNYFSLFKLPTAFEIDLSVLDSQLRALQTQYHPDVIDSKTDNKTNHRQSEQMSAVINQGYQTLRYPDSRASHLLALVGQDAHIQDSIYDLDFLDLAMDFRIRLDEADAQQLPSLQKQMQDWLAQLSNDFTQAYHQQDWQSAIDATQKLQFLVKIDKDISKKMDKSSQIDTLDDDLYV